VEAFAPGSLAADTYRALWREIDQRLDGRNAGRVRQGAG
jgi:hypothetical protein